MRHRQRTRKRESGKRALVLMVAALLLTLGYLYCRVSERVLYATAGRPGVQFRQLQHRWSRVAVLDLDLACPGVRVEVAAADATPRRSGCSAGAAHTVAEWCRATGAVG